MVTAYFYELLNVQSETNLNGNSKFLSTFTVLGPFLSLSWVSLLAIDTFCRHFYPTQLQ